MERRVKSQAIERVLANSGIHGRVTVYQVIKRYIIFSERDTLAQPTQNSMLGWQSGKWLWKDVRTSYPVMRPILCLLHGQSLLPSGLPSHMPPKSQGLLLAGTTTLLNQPRTAELSFILPTACSTPGAQSSTRTHLTFKIWILLVLWKDG